jgi:hypothetical protein
MFARLRHAAVHDVANRRPRHAWIGSAVSIALFLGVCLPAAAQAVPTIASVSPSTVPAGGPSFTLTVTGSGYVAGDVVEIDGSSRSTVYVSSRQLRATVLAPDIAAPGNLTVTVLSQGSGGPSRSNAATLTVGSPASSIGAPLSVTNMAIMVPRDGTVVMQGDELDAEAVLAGTGTGTVLGEWVWDGNPVEQFSATIMGGQRATIRTRQSLPTWLLGTHTLVLRMLQPNQTASRPIEVVVNPGHWKTERLLQPDYGAVYAAHAPPHLVWAIVPGAMKYQVGFSSEPYFSTIGQWFDVEKNDWQVPEKVWQALPEGKLYWTVRTVDASGQARKPLPMRVIYRAAEGKSSLRGPRPAARAARYMPVDARFNPFRYSQGGVYRQAVPIRTNFDAAAALPSPPTAQAAANPAPAAANNGTDAEAPPAKGAAAKRTGPSEDGQIGLNTQWASGSNPPDSNALSVAEHVLYQRAPWSLEVNGTGLVNSILNPPVQRTSHGDVSAYVGQFGYQRAHWGANLRLGIVTPSLYTDAQFVAVPTARQGAELALKTPGGTFSGFINTDDEAPGGGPGISVPQRIAGASWQAPLPQRVQLRLMWLNTDDLGSATPKASGDATGALLVIHLTQKWLWTTEYAASYLNPDTTSSASTRAFGRAWRTAVTGQQGNTTANIDYRDVSANFGNPANPGLTQDSQPNVRGVDASIAQTTKAGAFGLNYTFLANNVHPVSSDELLLNTFEETWSKQLNVKTNLALDARQSLTTTGTVPTALSSTPPNLAGAADARDVSGSINLSRQAGGVTLSLGGQRDWNHNTLLPAGSTITTSLNTGANLVTQGIFQLNSQASVTWVAGDGLTVGTSRTVSFNLQPALVWKRPAVQLAPIVTVTQAQTVLASGTLTADTLTGQYGGRLAWTLPGVLKFSTVSAQGSYNQNRNTVTGLDQPTTQLLALWTATWGHKHTF